MPFIDDYAPPGRKGIWMSVFLSAIPIGTALGYVYAGKIAEVASWEWAFMLEAPLMAPFAIISLFVPYQVRACTSLYMGGLADLFRRLRTLVPPLGYPLWIFLGHP